MHYITLLYSLIIKLFKINVELEAQKIFVFCSVGECCGCNRYSTYFCFIRISSLNVDVSNNLLLSPKTRHTVYLRLPMLTEPVNRALDDFRTVTTNARRLRISIEVSCFNCIWTCLAVVNAISIQWCYCSHSLWTQRLPLGDTIGQPFMGLLPHTPSYVLIN